MILIFYRGRPKLMHELGSAQLFRMRATLAGSPSEYVYRVEYIVRSGLTSRCTGNPLDK